jgi:DNA-binding MarR family transcriptional regulator
MANREPSSGPPSLHTSLVHRTGYLVSQVGAFAARRFGERLASIGLTTWMWGALNVLDAEGTITQQQLGKAIGMDPSSMVAAIDELESKGLVQRRAHPSDRRAHALHVTDQGHEVLARARKVSVEAQEELLAPLNADERRQLHELLTRLAIAAKDMEAPAVTTKRPSPSPRGSR